jgi:hypothetical protein
MHHGANVHVQDGPFGFAPQSAANSDYWNVIELLLTHGADANAQGGAFEMSYERLS